MRQQDNIDLRQIWDVIDRKKWAIIGLTAVVGLIASLIASSITPIYRASSTILIESDQRNVVSIDEVYGIDTRNQEYYKTQSEILRSRSIAEAVITELNLANSPAFRGEDSEAGILGRLKPKQRGAVAPDPQQLALEIYRKSLTVAPVVMTRLINVRFDSSDAELAARVANAHAEAYIGSIVNARKSVTRSAADWMSERIEGLKQQLLTSEQKLQEFREQEELIDAEGAKSLPAREINDLSTRLVDAKRRLSAARTSYLQVYPSGAALPEELNSMPAVLDNDVVQELQRAEAEAEQNVAELAERYGPKHPKLIAARAELSKAQDSLARQRRSVAESIRVDYDAARSEVAELEGALQIAKQEYQDIGRKESMLAELQKEVDANRDLYDIFYSRVKETAETMDLETANARIITPAAVPNEPYKPRKFAIVAIALALALGFCLVAAFLLDSLDNKVRNSADVSTIFNAPPLAAVPAIKNTGDILRTRLLAGAYGVSLIALVVSTLVVAMR